MSPVPVPGDGATRPVAAGAHADEAGTQGRRSNSDGVSNGDAMEDMEKSSDEDYDGHRLSLAEIRRITSSRDTGSSIHRRPSVATATDGAALGAAGRSTGIAGTMSRRESIISRIRSRAVPEFTHPLAHQRTGPELLVDFDGADDPYRPLNWPTRKKIATTTAYGFVTMSATWASSSYSAGTAQVASEFHVGTQVATLGTTLFLLGFGTGPLLWAPLSEVYGRRSAVLVPMFVAICFSFGSATAKDFQTLMITRFFGAFFASAPVTNTGGVLGDLYTPAWRGIAMAGYAMAVVAGPAIGMSIP